MPNGVPALESAQYIVLRSIEQRERKLAESSGQEAAGRNQRSEIRCQRSDDRRQEAAGRLVN
jgi:hypothetical protein